MVSIFILAICPVMGSCQQVDGPWEGVGYCQSLRDDYNRGQDKRYAEFRCLKIDKPAWEIVQ